MKNIIIFDARNLIQYYLMLSVHKIFFNKYEIYLFWYGSENDYKKINEFIRAPSRVFYFNLHKPLNNKNFLLDLSARQLIKKKTKIIKNSINKILLFTSFPNGLYFEYIKKNLDVKNKDTFVFDDGNINNFIIKNKWRLLIFLRNCLVGLFIFPSKYRLFSDSRFTNIYTINSNAKFYNKHTKNIIFIKKYFLETIKKDAIKIKSIPKRSAILITAPLVESNRMDINKYQDMISNIIKQLEKYKISNIIHSIHPSETEINKKFYNKNNFLNEYSQYPAELILLNKNINYIISPANSTLMLGESFPVLFKNIDFVFLYSLPMTFMHSIRLDKVKNFLERANIKFVHIDNHEK
jgi:hypothetical protein